MSKTLKDLNLTKAAMIAVLHVAQSWDAIDAAGVALARTNRKNRATGLTKIIKSTSNSLEIGCSETGHLVASWCNNWPMTKIAGELIEDFETKRREEIAQDYPELVAEIAAITPA